MKRRDIFFIISILLLSSCAYAVPEIYSDFLVSTADAINKFLSELADRLVFMGMMWTKISNIKYEIYNNLPYFLLNDPRPESPDISSVSRYFISFLEPLYVMAILLTGIYLLFFSGTPQGRVRAKSMLISLIMGMVVISVSTYLIQLLFSISNTLTRDILGQGPLDIGFTYRKAVDYLNYRAIDFMWTNIILGIPFMVLSILMTAGIFIILAARYLFLIFLIVLFPIAIFLTLFPLTKTIGNIVIRQLIFWTFIPAAYALILVTIGVSSQNLTGMILEISDIISLTGTVILIISPLILFGVMDWIGVFVSYSLHFVRLDGPVTLEGREIQTASGKAEQKKKRKTETTSAVGTRGYASVEEEEKGGKKTAARKVRPLDLGDTEQPPEQLIPADREERNCIPPSLDMTKTRQCRRWDMGRRDRKHRQKNQHTDMKTKSSPEGINQTKHRQKNQHTDMKTKSSPEGRAQARKQAKKQVKHVA